MVKEVPVVEVAKRILLFKPATVVVVFDPPPQAAPEPMINPLALV